MAEDDETTLEEPVQGAPQARLGLSSVIPPLRRVMAKPLRVHFGAGGESQEDTLLLIQLEDPEGLASRRLRLSVQAFALTTLFDGKRTVAEIVRAYEDSSQTPIRVEEVLEVAERLEQAMLLDSPSFAKRLRRALHRYMSDPVRPAAHAGECYPADEEELRATVRGYFALRDGPGRAPHCGPAAAHRYPALILPHIDPRVGGATYAHGYQALLEGCQADLYVVLGVAHQAAAEDPFLISTKDFATPLGLVKTAGELARKVQAALPANPVLAEYLHKREHSVEIQAVFLKALLGAAGRDFEILPVLCGPIEPFLDGPRQPMHEAPFETFVGTLRNELDKSGRRWCVLASVDFSHVGPKFDDATMVTERTLLPVERYDRRLLSKLEALDGEGFFFEISRTSNSRHVDAGMAVLALLALSRGVLQRGRLLHYAKWLETATHSAVSYAAMAFEAGAEA